MLNPANRPPLSPPPAFPAVRASRTLAPLEVAKCHLVTFAGPSPKHRPNPSPACLGPFGAAPADMAHFHAPQTRKRERCCVCGSGGWVAVVPPRWEVQTRPAPNTPHVNCIRAPPPTNASASSPSPSHLAALAGAFGGSRCPQRASEVPSGEDACCCEAPDQSEAGLCARRRCHAPVARTVPLTAPCVAPHVLPRARAWCLCCFPDDGWFPPLPRAPAPGATCARRFLSRPPLRAPPPAPPTHNATDTDEATTERTSGKQHQDSQKRRAAQQPRAAAQAPRMQWARSMRGARPAGRCRLSLWR